MLQKRLTVADLVARLQDLIAEGHGHCLVITEGCDCDGDAGSVRVKDNAVYIDRVADVSTETERQAAEKQRLEDQEKRQKEALALWDRLKQGPINQSLATKDVEHSNLPTEPLEF